MLHGCGIGHDSIIAGHSADGWVAFSSDRPNRPWGGTLYLRSGNETAHCGKSRVSQEREGSDSVHFLSLQCPSTSSDLRDKKV